MTEAYSTTRLCVAAVWIVSTKSPNVWLLPHAQYSNTQPGRFVLVGKRGANIRISRQYSDNLSYTLRSTSPWLCVSPLESPFHSISHFYTGSSQRKCGDHCEDIHSIVSALPSPPRFFSDHFFLQRVPSGKHASSLALGRKFDVFPDIRRLRLGRVPGCVGTPCQVTWPRVCGLLWTALGERGERAALVPFAFPKVLTPIYTRGALVHVSCCMARLPSKPFKQL